MRVINKHGAQANTLRAWARRGPNPHKTPDVPLQVVAVGGGKGGVGKTFIAANIAAKLSAQHLRVLALDGDMGLANLDIALGVRAHRSLHDVVHGDCDVRDVVVTSACGVDLLPGCSGRFELANLSEEDQQRILSRVNTLEHSYDVLVVDTAAGLGANALSLAAAVQQVIVVVTPDPSSMSDAYAFMKVLSGRYGVQHFHVLANLTRTVSEGEDLYVRLSVLAERFLTVRVDYLGNIPLDTAARRSMRLGAPIVASDPLAPASQSVAAVCKRLMLCDDQHNFGSMRLFWQRLLEERSSA